MELLEIPATVRVKNQMTIPQQIAERHNIAPGQQLVIVDGPSKDEFTVRIIRSSYAGALAGVFGTTEQNLEFVRSERKSWD